MDRDGTSGRAPVGSMDRASAPSNAASDRLMDRDGTSDRASDESTDREGTSLDGASDRFMDREGASDDHEASDNSWIERSRLLGLRMDSLTERARQMEHRMHSWTEMARQMTTSTSTGKARENTSPHLEHHQASRASRHL